MTKPNKNCSEMDKNCTGFENWCKNPREASTGRVQQCMRAGGPLPCLLRELGGALWPPTHGLCHQGRQGWVTALPPPLLGQGLFPGPRAGPLSRFPHSPAASFRPGAHMALGRHSSWSPHPCRHLCEQSAPLRHLQLPPLGAPSVPVRPEL